ncbi:MAG: radical SAM protein [Elusimicrobia bacterium]|nr:radical SAM protein [Elusimicrobiota bacterium]
MSAPAVRAYPVAPLTALDTVWFQVAGTLCNIRCAHCFISCAPDNRSFPMMTRAEVGARLREAEEFGAREYYFTGGEPFMNKEIFEILGDALALGPVSVLTNALLIKPKTAARLKSLAGASPYSLDLRVSLDGYDAATNDPIRGEGTFDRIMAGLGELAAAGHDPVVTTTEACEGVAASEGRARFLEFLRAAGLKRPRLKVLPLLRLGAETARTHAYESWETLRGRELSETEGAGLQCTTSRMVTAKGVYVCPLLIDFPGARLAATLRESLRPFELAYPACFTCHATGLSCRT